MTQDRVYALYVLFVCTRLFVYVHSNSVLMQEQICCICVCVYSDLHTRIIVNVRMCIYVCSNSVLMQERVCMWHVGPAAAVRQVRLFVCACMCVWSVSVFPLVSLSVSA